MPQYHLRRRNSKDIQGPLDATLLMEMSRSGNLHPEDKLQIAGKADMPWLDAWRYRELFPLEVAARYEAAANTQSQTTTQQHSQSPRRKLVWIAVACGSVAVIWGVLYWTGKRAAHQHFVAFMDHIGTEKRLNENATQEGRDFSDNEMKELETKVKALEATHASLWPWQRDTESTKYVTMQRDLLDLRKTLREPPKMDANDPKGSFERFYRYYFGDSRMSKAHETLGGDADSGVGTLDFEFWDVRKTDSLKNPIVAEAIGKWHSGKLGDYRITLNFVWRDSTWLTTTIGAQWSGKHGYGEPDRDAAMRAATRIIAKLNLPTAPD